MCFEEASRIGIKISFIKIAGVLIRKRRNYWCNISCSNYQTPWCWNGINYTHDEKTWWTVKLIIIDRKGPDFKKALIRNIASVTGFLIKTEKVVVPVTTVFVDTRLSKSKRPLKRFQNFRQSCVLSTDRIEIHQSQPLVWPSDLLYVMLAGCDWWISIRSVDNMHDWESASQTLALSPVSTL